MEDGHDWIRTEKERREWASAVIERLEKAENSLNKLHGEACERAKTRPYVEEEATRLSGKVEGVRLALSYLREEQ